MKFIPSKCLSDSSFVLIIMMCKVHILCENRFIFKLSSRAPITQVSNQRVANLWESLGISVGGYYWHRVIQWKKCNKNSQIPEQWRNNYDIFRSCQSLAHICTFQVRTKIRFYGFIAILMFFFVIINSISKCEILFTIY